MRGCKSLLLVVVSLLVKAVGLASAASAPSTSWEAGYGGRTSKWSIPASKLWTVGTS